MDLKIFGYALCVIAATTTICITARSVANAMARQPEVKGNLFTVFILAAAFIESLCLIGFVVAIM